MSSADRILKIAWESTSRSFSRMIDGSGCIREIELWLTGKVFRELRCLTSYRFDQSMSVSFADDDACHYFAVQSDATTSPSRKTRFATASVLAVIS